MDLAENAAQARSARQANAYDLVLLDIWMPDTDGVSLLKEWSMTGMLTMPVIMMSGHATIETAVEATRIGAFSFLEKPITLQKLLKAVQQGLVREPARRPAAAPVSAASPVLVGGAAAPNAAPMHMQTESQPMAVSPAYAPVAPVAAPSPLATGSQSFDLDKPLREARDEFERAYFAFHLQRENGSMTRVAEKTGLERTHLYRKLKQLGVDIGREKKSAAAS